MRAAHSEADRVIRRARCRVVREALQQLFEHARRVRRAIGFGERPGRIVQWRAMARVELERLARARERFVRALGVAQRVEHCDLQPWILRKALHARAGHGERRVGVAQATAQRCLAEIQHAFLGNCARSSSNTCAPARTLGSRSSVASGGTGSAPTTPSAQRTMGGPTCSNVKRASTPGCVSQRCTQGR